MIYRVDLHVHTEATDGSLSSLDELVRAARKAGLDAIAVTDRDRCTPVPPALRGVVLIPGCEISTLGGQILGVFLDRPVDFVHLTEHGLPTADEAVLAIHRCGGLAVLAHPFAAKAVNPALFPIRPDAVETVSARASQLRPDANKRALLWAADHQRPKVGCSNAHSSAELGNAYTEIACRDLTYASLKEAVDLGHCRAVSVRDTSKTACGRTELARAKSRGRKRDVLKSALSLGFCTLMDLAPKPKPKTRKKK